jgi:hypothetical protein
VEIGALIWGLHVDDLLWQILHELMGYMGHKVWLPRHHWAMKGVRVTTVARGSSSFTDLRLTISELKMYTGTVQD